MSSAARDDALARRGTSAHEAKSGELRHSEPRHASASSVGGRLPTAGGEDCPATGDSHAARDRHYVHVRVPLLVQRVLERLHVKTSTVYMTFESFERSLR